MSKRRRFEPDGNDSHGQKRRRTDQNEIEERLESLITRVGEKSTSSLESNLEGLAVVLQADLPNYKPKIIQILCECAVDLPEKLSVYTTLVGLINVKNYECGGDFAEELWARLKELMKANEWDRARTLVRFIADLVNCRVVDVSSIVALYEAFAEAAAKEEGVPQVRRDWFVHAILSTLPWVGGEIAEKKDEELEKILSLIGTYLKTRKKDHVAMLRVWHTDTPHPQEDGLDCLWTQTTKLRNDEWNHKSILRPYLAFDSVLCEALQHTLPPFTVPPHAQGNTYPLAKVVFRMFDYTDAPEGPTMPGHHSIERYLVEEQLSCIINAYIKDRKECAVQLVSYHGKAKVPLNYMIVEVVFGQLFNLPQSVKNEVAYTSLLLELCKLQPSSLPQVLAQASELLYERLDKMNLSCIDRFVNWFSHHLSNFQFRWSWDEWVDCLAMDLQMPKPKFVQEVLVKCMRLSYHQRVVESINKTEEFAPLLPQKPIPVYKYKEEGAGSLPGTMIANKLMETIKARATPAEVLAVLDDVPNPTQDPDSMEDESTFNPLKIDIFVQTLLFLGQKSFSHSFRALAKFHSVFKVLADSQESQIHILKMVRELWCNHQQMVCVLIDKMLRTQIVSCPAVANWLFSSSMSGEFTKGYVWEIIHATLRKMSSQVGRLETELKEVREKAHRKKTKGMDSDEDEEEEEESDSDGGEDAETQIERLQEALETAQSEQKNLFLIIFQRFIMILTEHLVTCENRGVTFHTPWYDYCIQRLQQIFLMHYNQILAYTSTLEDLLFTGDTDPNILRVFQEFRSLSS